MAFAFSMDLFFLAFRGLYLRVSQSKLKNQKSKFGKRVVHTLKTLIWLKTPQHLIPILQLWYPIPKFFDNKSVIMNFVQRQDCYFSSLSWRFELIRFQKHQLSFIKTLQPIMSQIASKFNYSFFIIRLKHRPQFKGSMRKQRTHIHSLI